MDWSNFLAAQNVMTIGAFLLIAIGLFAFFLRRQGRTARRRHNAFSGDPEPLGARPRKAERTDQEPNVPRVTEEAATPSRSAVRGTRSVTTTRPRHPERAAASAPIAW